MNVTLVMVQSANGMLTRGSAEDRAHFSTLKADSDVIIMGRRTYEAHKTDMTLTEKPYRIVMSSRSGPSVPHMLEFTGETPDALIARLRNAGYKRVLLVGGSALNASFLKGHLITDCYLTVEPEIIPETKHLFDGVDESVSLDLSEHRVLNEQGTIVLHYTVRYDH